MHAPNTVFTPDQPGFLLCTVCLVTGIPDKGLARVAHLTSESHQFAERARDAAGNKSRIDAHGHRLSAGARVQSTVSRELIGNIVKINPVSVSVQWDGWNRPMKAMPEALFVQES